MKFRFRTGVKVAAALACGVGLTLAIPMLPAVGQSSPPGPAVKVQSPATIAVRGVVAFAPVLVACPAGDEPSLDVSITERSGKNIAQGNGSPLSLVCTGGIQKVTVSVLATNHPFVVGQGFAVAQMFDCNIETCSATFDQRAIKLVPKG